MEKNQRFALFCDRIIAFCFCALIFFIPISIALAEWFSALPVFFFLLKRSVLYAQGFSQGQRNFAQAFAPRKNPLNALVWGFLLINFVSIFFSYARSESIIGFLGKVLQNVFIFFAFTEAMVTRERMRVFFKVAFASFALICIDGLYQNFGGRDFIRGKELHEGRVYACLRQPNDFAAYLIAFIPSVFIFVYDYVISWKKKASELKASMFSFHKRSGFLITIVLILAFWCLGLTFSRSGWLALFLIFIIFGCKNRITFLSMVGLWVIFLVVFFDLLIDKRVQFFDIYDVFYFNNRFTYWEGAWSIFLTRPILGTGVNTYSQVAKDFMIQWGGYPHNCYLQMLVETGVLGLGSFLWIIWRASIHGIQGWKEIPNSFNKGRLEGVLLGFWGFMFFSFWDTTLYSAQLNNLFWIFLGLIVMLPSVLKGRPTGVSNN